MKTIQSNTTLYTRSIGDHNCIYSINVLERKGNWVVILFEGKIMRKKIRVYGDEENIMPYKYSGAPIFGANDTARPKTDWEK